MATEHTGQPSTPWLDRAMLAGLLVRGGAIQFSIVIGQTALWLTLVAWVVSLVVRRERPGAPRWFWPLLAYVGISLVAAAFSIDRYQSLGATKQMLLFLVVPATYSIAAGQAGAHGLAGHHHGRGDQRDHRRHRVRHPRTTTRSGSGRAARSATT